MHSRRFMTCLAVRLQVCYKLGVDARVTVCLFTGVFKLCRVSACRLQARMMSVVRVSSRFTSVLLCSCTPQESPQDSQNGAPVSYVAHSSTVTTHTASTYQQQVPAAARLAWQSEVSILMFSTLATGRNRNCLM